MAVVVSSDGTEESLRVLPHAAKLAQAAGRRLVLVRAFDRVLHAEADAPKDGLDPREETHLRRAISSTGVQATLRAVPSGQPEEPSDAILQAASEEMGVLLALCSHARGPITARLLGSTSQALIQASTIPVMAAGPRLVGLGSPGPYRIAVLGDSAASVRRILAALRPVFADRPVDLFFLSVYTPKLGDAAEDAELEALRASIEEVVSREVPDPARAHVFVRSNHPFQSLEKVMLDMVTELGISVVAMNTRSYGTGHDVLLGSTSRAILGAAAVPVILAGPSLAAV